VSGLARWFSRWCRRAALAPAAAAALAVAVVGCAAPSHPAVTASAAPGVDAGAPAGLDDRVIVVTVVNRVAELPRIAGSTAGLYGRRPRYVAGSDAQALLADVARDHHLVPLAAWPIPVLGVHCATLLIPEGASRAEVLAALQADARVDLALPLNRYTTLASVAVSAQPYDDPYLPLQRALQQQGVLQAHRCTRGQGTRIAVIDTGVDTAHPDLQGVASDNANFVDRDLARFRRDSHGTEVAGIIAAQPGNARGIVGIAPDAHLIMLKACWERSDGSAACNSFTLAQALSAAIDRGAQVINLSLGGPADALLTRLVRSAQARGAVVVGAQPAGAAHDGFPGGVRGVIVAGDAAASGGGGLGAPAREVLTLMPGGRYDFASGTSMAAAQLSAITALLLERRPGLGADAIEDLLRKSSAPDTGGGPNACRALAALDSRCRCSAAD